MKNDQPQDDDSFARALEQRHQDLLATPTGGRESAHQENERVDSAAQVLNLLHRYTTAIGDQETLPSKSPYATPTEQAAPEAKLLELDSLGRFTNLRLLGRGGFGVVFQATDPKLGRDVALKIPRWDTRLTENVHRRFEREALAAGKLDHPNIVKVHEVGTERGLDFIVSEFVDGENLEAYLARGNQFGICESAQIAAQMADAIEHAHQRGVLHRDLKPANVLLESPSESTTDIRVCLADFGLAWVADQHGLTRSGTLVGTPEFMSPEQAAGTPDKIDERSDVYGLGALLYYLLTGRTPLAGAGILDKLQAIRETSPTPPSQFNTAVPRDLDAICLKCLEKIPAARYSTARELQADLNRFLNGQAIVARPAGKLTRLFRWSRQHPVAASLTGLAMFATTTAIIVFSLLWQSSEQHRKLAETNRDRALEKSRQLTQAIDRLFSSLALNPEIRKSSADGLRRTLLEEATAFRKEFFSETPDDPDLRSEYARSIGQLAKVYAQLGDYRESVALFRQAIDISTDSGLKANPLQVTDWWLDIAESQVHLGQFSDAEKSFGNADRINDSIGPEQAEDIDRWQWQHTRITLARARKLLQEDEHLAAEKLAHEVLDQLRAIKPRSAQNASQYSVPRLAVVSHRAIARYLVAQTSRLKGEFQQAIQYYRLAINDYETTRSATIDSDGLQYDLARCWLGIGLAYAEQNLADEAAEPYQRALQLADEMARKHPKIEIYRSLVAQIQYSYSVNRMLVEDYAKFSDMIEANVQEKKQLAKDFPDAQGKYLGQLGNALNLKYVGLNRQGEASTQQQLEVLEQAERAFKDAIEAQPERLWNRMAACRVIANKGFVHYQSEDFLNAVNEYQAAVKEVQKILDDEPQWAEAISLYFTAATGLMKILEEQGQLEAAISVAQEFVGDYPEQPRSSELKQKIAELETLKANSPVRDGSD